MTDPFRCNAQLRAQQLFDEVNAMPHSMRREVFSALRGALPNLTPAMFIPSINMTVGTFCVMHVLSRKRRTRDGGVSASSSTSA